MIRRFVAGRRPAVVAAGLGVGAILGAGVPVVVAAPVSAVVDAPGGVTLTDLDSRLVILVNQERAARGLAPVRVVAGLSASAALHSQGNAAGRRLDHDRRLGRSATAAGCRWSLVGEVIASTRGAGVTAAEVLRMYRGSPGHWRLLMDPRFTAVGVGTVDWRDRIYGRAIWNTIRLVDACSAGTRGATAPWGLYSERLRVPRGSTTPVVDLRNGDDARVVPGAWDRARSVAAVQVARRPGDTGTTIRLRAGSASATGTAGLMVRQGIETRAGKSLRIRLRATTPSGSRLPVWICVWDGFGTVVVVGRVMAGVQARTVVLRLPPAARGFVNHLSLAVPAGALLAQGRSSSRWRATLSLESVAVTS